MESEYKCSEVTFKYYLPDHEDELYLHSHASDMYSLLFEIDNVCRSLIKYGDEKIKDPIEFAEKIREMIHNNIDMDKIR